MTVHTAVTHNVYRQFTHLQYTHIPHTTQNIWLAGPSLNHLMYIHVP